MNEWIRNEEPYVQDSNTSFATVLYLFFIYLLYLCYITEWMFEETII